jgi:hypothetical protein
MIVQNVSTGCPTVREAAGIRVANDRSYSQISRFSSRSCDVTL